MQFQRDIPKTEHEFEIPDVAEFPDVATEERYQDNDKMDVLVKQLEDLFKRRKTKTELQVAFEKIIEFSKADRKKTNSDNREFVFIVRNLN